MRHKGPVIVKGRADDSDKGRVVLAEEIKPLEDAVGNGSLTGDGHGNGAGHGHPMGHGNGHGNGHVDAHACRIRVSAAAESLPTRLAAIKLAEIMPQARAVFIPGAGHMGAITHSAEVNGHILDQVGRTRQARRKWRVAV